MLELESGALDHSAILTGSVFYAEVCIALDFLVGLGVSEFFQSALSHSKAALSP